MKIIRVPAESIILSFEDERGVPRAKPFSWEDFIKGLCSDQRFVEGCRDVFEAIDLRKKLLDHLEPKSTFELADADWNLLVSITKKPPFVPMAVYQIESYLRAIVDAETAK